MSVLHSRIITHAATAAPAQAASASNLPYGTSATPMVMPLASVEFNQGTGVYQTLFPSQPATADVNAVPIATITKAGHADVRPAGRP